MRFVAQPLQEVKHWILRRQGERRPAGNVKFLAAGIAVGPFGNGNDRQVLDAKFLQNRQARRKLSSAAVQQHQVWPLTALAAGVLALRAGKAAAQHFAHGGVIVAGGLRGAPQP